MKTLRNLVIPILILAISSGCAAINRPRMLHRSMEVNKIMESREVLQNHTYYYTGSQDKPDAIIAISNEYQLQESVNWVRIKVDEKQLRDWNLVIDNAARIYLTYDGYYIMTPDGRRAGILYSKYSFTVIKYPAPNRIVIYPPDPTPEQRLRERLHGWN